MDVFVKTDLEKQQFAINSFQLLNLDLILIIPAAFVFYYKDTSSLILALREFLNDTKFELVNVIEWNHRNKNGHQ